MVSAISFYFFYYSFFGRSPTMNEYLKAQSKTNESIINLHFSEDELARFSKSDYRWAENSPGIFRQREVKKGEVYQFEFGKNYCPEMSYEHRGLVIGVRNKLLLVLPIFSYLPDKHTDVYHPIDCPDSKSDLYLLRKQDYGFIEHDSVLKLNDLRTVSVNRILYQHKGRIMPSSEEYKNIELLTFHKLFPSLYHDYQATLGNNKALSNQLNSEHERMESLEAELLHLKEMAASSDNSEQSDTF